jgi:hypothetical protein
MGIGHALALPGCCDALADAFGPRPLLTPPQLSFLGIELDGATNWERRQAADRSFRYVTSRALAGDPAGPADAAAQALGALPPGPLAVHVDVDVLDFTDAPLAESTGGRNSGPPWTSSGRHSALPWLIPGARSCRSASSIPLAVSAPRTPSPASSTCSAASPSSSAVRTAARASGRQPISYKESRCKTLRHRSSRCHVSAVFSAECRLCSYLTARLRGRKQPPGPRSARHGTRRCPDASPAPDRVGQRTSSRPERRHHFSIRRPAQQGRVGPAAGLAGRHASFSTPSNKNTVERILCFLLCTGGGFFSTRAPAARRRHGIVLVLMLRGGPATCGND